MSVCQSEDFHSLVKALKSRYCPAGQEMQYFAKLMSRSWKRHEETVTDYAYDLLRLARKAYPGYRVPEKIMIDLFKKGLVHSMQIQVNLRSPQTLSEALSIALAIEPFEKSGLSGKKHSDNVFAASIPSCSDPPESVNIKPCSDKSLSIALDLEPFEKSGLSGKKHSDNVFAASIPSCSDPPASVNIKSRSDKALSIALALEPLEKSGPSGKKHADNVFATSIPFCSDPPESANIKSCSDESNDETDVLKRFYNFVQWEKGQQNPRSPDRYGCFYCKRRGHRIANCRKLQNKNARAANI